MNIISLGSPHSYGSSRWRRLAALSVVLSALPLPAATPPPASPGLIPVETFTAAQKISRARLSPDGRHLASLIEIDGDPWLMITDLDTQKSARVNPGRTRNGLTREVSAFRWVSDDRISFLTTVWDGSMFTGVSAVNCDGTKWFAFAGPDADPYNPRPFLATQIIHSFGDADQNVLMLDRGMNSGADLIFPDVAKVSTLTGVYDTVVKNPGNVVRWFVDHNGVVRLGLTRNELRSSVIYRENEQAKWRELAGFDQIWGQLTPLGFDYGDRRLIVTTFNEQKRRAVYYYDIATEKLGDLIASHPDFDIIPEMGNASIEGATLAGPIGSDVSGSIVGIRFITEGPRTVWFDPGLAEVQTMLESKLPNTINMIVSRSRDEKRLLVLAFSDRDPGKYYLLDFTKDRPSMTGLSMIAPNVPVEQMAPMLLTKYRARDGETIHAYLTLPLGGQKTHLPLIVMPHGGPTVRDIWHYQPMVQFLASRGYAVLQMNYRGSPGYGSEFYAKGKREVGRGIQNDIEDGTRWAIAKGIADPKRVAIIGGSYGGYSALFALGNTPELYRCGISIAGVTDWADIVRERKGEEYRFAFLHFKEWIGDPKIDASFLASISPVNFADKIKAPVFIVQGKDDRVVPPKQARKMVAALEQAGLKPQTLYFSAEGHGIKQPKNREKLFREMEIFLQKNLAPTKDANAGQ